MLNQDRDSLSAAYWLSPQKAMPVLGLTLAAAPIL